MTRTFPWLRSRREKLEEDLALLEVKIKIAKREKELKAIEEGTE